MAEAGRRQVATLTLIPRYPRSITTSNIKKHLSDIGIKASIRMIQRDLESLERTYPLICNDIVKPYKWSWMQDAQGKLFPSMDPIHAFTLALSMQHLKTLIPKSSFSRVENYFQLANQTLSKDNQIKMKKWLSKVKVFPRGQPLITATIRTDVEEIIYEALFDDKKIKASYLKREAKISTDYILSPLGLVIRSAVHYLICSLNHDSENIRWLPLHRFKKAIQLNESVYKPKGFNLNRFIKSNSLGFLISNKAINIELVFTKQAGFHLTETPLNKTQKIIKTKNNDLRVKATVDDTSELRFWISGFGPSVKVIKPSSLKKEFQKRSKELENLYA
jgi:predicted DNA-binding transcriptional regulator YafY